jgi:ribonuclease R
VIRSRRRSSQVARAEGAGPLKKETIYPYTPQALVEAGEHCSMTERRADDATRDVEAWLKCEYLSDRVGEVFPGIVAAVTGFGLFVELTDLYVEGLVHVTALANDYYQFDRDHQRLVGERTRVVWQLGDAITVQVVRVDLDERKIDLEPVGQPERTARRGGSGKRSRGPGRSAGKSKSGKGSRSRRRRS